MSKEYISTYVSKTLATPCNISVEENTETFYTADKLEVPSV